MDPNLLYNLYSEEYHGHLEYVIPLNELKWSWAFGFMESVKQTLPIKDYSITQVSLEHLFLLFMKKRQ